MFFMKSRLIIVSFLVVLIFINCRSGVGDIPKALENKKSTIEIVTKRGYDDLIESLYMELVSKEDDLKMLEKRVKEISVQRSDSTEAFTAFNGRNLAFYNSAANHIGTITDTLLRDSVKNIFNQHIQQYNLSVERQHKLLDTVVANVATTADLYVLIKLFKTLPLIEKFQQSNQPDSASIVRLIEEQKALIAYADSILKMEKK